MNDPHPLLASYGTVIELPVHWGEQDLNGHVNHGAPVRWLESARMAFVCERSIDTLLRSAELALIITSLQCKYLRQISYPDHVLVGVRLAELTRATMRIEQAVLSQQQQQIAIEAEVRVAVFDPQAQRPRRIPREMVEALQG